jgi:acyl-coenzyme A thioesterase 9
LLVHISYLNNKSQNINIDGHDYSPIVVVTGLVDRIEVSNFHITMDKNIKLSGFTSWVGKTSAEVTMKLEQETNDKTWTHVLEAKFLMCARDTSNKGSAVMNPLNLQTEEDKAIFAIGESQLIYR